MITSIYKRKLHLLSRDKGLLIRRHIIFFLENRRRLEREAEGSRNTVSDFLKLFYFRYDTALWIYTVANLSEPPQSQMKHVIFFHRNRSKQYASVSYLPRVLGRYEFRDWNGEELILLVLLILCWKYLNIGLKCERSESIPLISFVLHTCLPSPLIQQVRLFTVRYQTCFEYTKPALTLSQLHL